MKRIIVADLHFSVYSAGKIKEGLPEKLFYLKRTFTNICDYAMENNIKTIDILGDIYHNKFLIYSLAQSVFLNIIRSYPNLTFNCLQGNHDISSKGDNPTSCLLGLKYEPNVNVYMEPYQDKENDILYVPYFNGMAEYIKENTARTLYSHFGLNEAMVNSGLSIRTDIKLSDLKGKYKNVFLGHYHLPQEIIDKGIKCFYAGSIIQLTKGEKNEIKRFLIFDTETDKVESVPTVGYKKLYEFVITNENKNEMLREAKKLKNSDEESEINIVIKEDMDDLSEIDESVSSMDDVNLIDKRELDIEKRADISSYSSNEEIINAYLAYKNIDESKIEKYKEIGLKYFSEK